MGDRGLEHVLAMEAVAARLFREPIRVAEIARAVGLHPAYASVVYRRARGTTLVRHLTELRVRYAVSRLAKGRGSASVIEIAFDSGFGSVSAFYDAFRRVTGGCPAQAAACGVGGAAVGAAGGPAMGPASSLTHALWVDDQPLNNLDERRALAGLGVFTDSYRSSDEAAAAFGQGGYGLIISDVRRQNARETGWDFAREALRRAPRLPLLFYCGFVDSERRGIARRMGARGIFARRAELMAAVSASVGPATAGATADGGAQRNRN